jgi:hypothetical protein
MKLNLAVALLGSLPLCLLGGATALANTIELSVAPS